MIQFSCTCSDWQWPWLAMPSYFPFPNHAFPNSNRSNEKMMRAPHSVTAAVRIRIQVFAPIIEKNVSALTFRHGSWSKNNYPQMPDEVLSLLSLVLNCSRHIGLKQNRLRLSSITGTAPTLISDLSWLNAQTRAAGKKYGVTSISNLCCIRHKKCKVLCSTVLDMHKKPAQGNTKAVSVVLMSKYDQYHHHDVTENLQYIFFTFIYVNDKQQKCQVDIARFNFLPCSLQRLALSLALAAGWVSTQMDSYLKHKYHCYGFENILKVLVFVKWFGRRRF